MLSRENLHAYQNRSIEFIKKKRRCGLWISMGLGKTTSTLTAILDLFEDFSIGKVLIIAPLRVANSVWKQEARKWKHLQNLRISICTGSERQRLAALQMDADVYVINRENVDWLVTKTRTNWQFDMLVIDECFVGNTMVLTSLGPRPIKIVSVGDLVITSSGVKTVSRVFKKEATRLVRVTLSDGKKIECTPEHPFATEIGWVQAKDIKGLRVVRSAIYNEEKDKPILQPTMYGKSKVYIKHRLGCFRRFQTALSKKLRTLWDSVFGKGKNKPVLLPWMFAQSDVGVDAGRSKEENDKQRINVEQGAHPLEFWKSLVRRREEKVERGAQEKRPQTNDAGWKRTYHPVRRTNEGDVIFGLGEQSRNTNKNEAGFQLPYLLQGGFCMARKEMDYRSGRELTHIAKNLGREAGQFSYLSRVDNVENIKLECEEFVYNLEVDGVHDYFAGEVLVHNCSSFKNSSSQRFKAIRKILPETEFMVLLTGTPSPNSLLDIWSQMYMIDFGKALGRTMTSFKHRFFEQDYMGYKFTLRAGSADKIHELIEPSVIHMSAEDYLDVPERIDLVEKIELPLPLMAQYKDFERTLLAELETGEEIEAMSAAVLANKLLQFSNGGMYTNDKGSWANIHTQKLDTLAEMIEDNPNENMLVAYNYRFDLERLQKKFPHAVLLDKKQETIDRWNRGEIKLMLAHPASAGHGLNLQNGGSLIVWFGMTWSLEYYQQFNARLHRQGQLKPVRVLHIVCKGTIDERVLSVLSTKDVTQKALLSALKPIDFNR